jgi:ATP adenylyltransferase
MQHIWAPWRMAYVGSEAPAGCIFCAKPGEDRDAQNFIVHRGEHAFVILNAYPYTAGHLLVAPYRHTADLTALSDAENLELMRLTRQSLEALKRAFAPHGFNVGMNLGRAGGAGIADHLHLHVVPRWEGDTNFMTVVADIRVVPEALSGTWQRLREVWVP